MNTRHLYSKLLNPHQSHNPMLFQLFATNLAFTHLMDSVAAKMEFTSHGNGGRVFIEFKNGRCASVIQNNCFDGVLEIQELDSSGAFKGENTGWIPITEALDVLGVISYVS